MTAEPMCMSMNTESTNMDDIVNGDDEAKDDYKSSVESDADADGGVISPHELVINPKHSLKEVVSQLVKVSGVSIDDFDITVDEMTESFEYSDHNWKGLSLQSKCDAIHHIFSMPAFQGKFDHLLELVCPTSAKERTLRRGFKVKVSVSAHNIILCFSHRHIFHCTLYSHLHTDSRVYC